MQEKILKRSIKPNATLKDIEIKLRQAIQVPVLEQVVSSNKIALDTYPNAPAYKEEIQELRKKIKEDEKTIEGYKKLNPFVAFGEKGNIKIDKDKKIIDDGYGRNEFYPIYALPSGKRPGLGGESGKKIIDPEIPLTIEEAALHYKKEIVDYDEVNVNREIPEQKPYDGPAYGSSAKKPKVQPTADVSKLKELKEKRQKLERKVREIQEILNSGLFPTQASSKKSQLTRLKNQIKSLDKKITESAKTKTSLRVEESRALPLDATTLNQIYEVLYPRSEEEIKTILIGLGQYLNNLPTPIDVEKLLKPYELKRIKEIIESVPDAINNPVDNYIRNLVSMVKSRRDKTLGVIKSIKLNRPNKKIPAMIKVIKDGNITINQANAILPLTHNFTDNDFSKFETFMEANYSPIPKVSNKNLFMKRLTTDIYGATGVPTNEELRSAGGSAGVDQISLNYMIEWLLIDNKLESELRKILTVAGQRLSPKERVRRISNLLNSAKYKNKNFIPLMQKYIFDESSKNLLTEKQVKEVEELLSVEIDGKSILTHLLSVIDTKFIVPSKSEVKTLRDKITPEMSDEEVAEIRSKGKKPKRKGQSMKNRTKPAPGPNADWRGRRDLPRRKIGVAGAYGMENSLEDYIESKLKKADISSLPPKKRREVKALLQNAHPTEYFGEDYLRLGKVINIIDGLAEDEEAELVEKLGVKNLQMVKTAASLRKKYENLYKKLYDMVYEEE